MAGILGGVKWLPVSTILRPRGGILSC
jgi:hypothetical protein